MEIIVDISNPPFGDHALLISVIVIVDINNYAINVNSAFHTCRVDPDPVSSSFVKLS